MNSNLKKLAVSIVACQGTFYLWITAYALITVSMQPVVQALIHDHSKTTTAFVGPVFSPTYRPVITIQDIPSPRSVELIEEVERLLGRKANTYPLFSNERTYGTGELECLAKNIYFEARQETLLGQVAVGLVTVHRVNDRRFPSDICGVAQQGGEATKHRCQFSWYCDGLPDTPREHEAYKFAQDVAAMVLDSATRLPDFTQGATHYHADYIPTPCWATRMEKVIHVDTHIFYREVPNYTPCVPKQVEHPLQASL